MTCLYDGRPTHAHSLCTKHYQRWKKTGDPLSTKYVVRGATKAHPLYNTYHNMLGRCKNPTDKRYEHYGGRGIKVCERWDSEGGFTRFVEDMGERPTGLTLNRVNNDGNYEPSNCEWADKYTQAGNTQANNPVPGVGWHKQRGKYRARIKINGKEKSLGLYDTFEEAVQARQSWVNLQR